MVINDLDVISFVIAPLETNPPLVVDADAILARSIAFEFLKAISWGSEQILKIFSIIEIDQFATSGALNILGQFG